MRWGRSVGRLLRGRACERQPHRLRCSLARLPGDRRREVLERVLRDEAQPRGWLRPLCEQSVEVEDGSLSSDASVVTVDSETATNVPKEPEIGEQEAYQAAYGLVRERQFSEALTAFSEFLNAYPFGRFAPNAHYWLGELYLVVEPVDPEAARQNFQVLLDQYPNDRKVPDALYKLGRVHALKGNAERSRSYLDRVIAEYGAEGHPAAQLAQDFIDSQ